ncbi:MAG TPA: tRNA glutamyl-Q(34) synthetase GluQRS [Gammaproteobacteria bacterium]|nr:tRNA glutamyl-Q(34) synthetase GluQRS [Gammaproteobacteria bacterium]
MNASAGYHGRFAPSPSGPLHFGSAVTALASFLDARVAGGRWSLRIENIDRRRERPAASEAILRGLARLGLEWDGAVVYQGERLGAYRAAIAALAARDLVYACDCSRREVGGRPYPGRCRERALAWTPGRALRLRVPALDVEFIDRLQGPYRQALAAECGDFVLWRADGDPAYHLAVVVDDAWQGISDVVRGADLLDSTPRQIHLQRLLGLPAPRYAHLPIALDAAGRKLSKQTADTRVDAAAPAEVLVAALVFLGQSPPAALRAASAAEVLAWGRAHWRPERIPRSSRRALLA